MAFNIIVAVAMHMFWMSSPMLVFVSGMFLQIHTIQCDQQSDIGADPAVKLGWNFKTGMNFKYQ